MSADPAATLRLLWRHGGGADPAVRPGPRQRVSVDAVVDTALEIADQQGLAAVSMRSLARELGIGAMSVYTYVSSREQLLELMVDQAMGRTELPAHPVQLRARLQEIGRTTYDEHRRHSWLTEAAGVRPGLGPHSTARYEWQLEALEGVGLDDVEMDQTVTLITGFAANAARSALDRSQSSGSDDAAWWETVAPTLSQLMPAGSFPVAQRVGAAAGEQYGAASDPDRELEFGLARITEGVLALVASRR